MTQRTTEIDLNKEAIKVIGYWEDGLCYALGLEVSILGYGETFEEAVSLLKELIQDQIEFCNENGMSYHYRSEEKYFQLYEELKDRESKTKNAKSGRSIEITYSLPTENQRPKIDQFSIGHLGVLSR
ncbi:MAG: hypothetical protein OXC39_00990 [Candidatus Dadabacteria bacterium]|nr:hypothetical protein [Candidatus Dadabacteria bacterium]